jgi:hypothetical protein
MREGVSMNLKRRLAEWRKRRRERKLRLAREDFEVRTDPQQAPDRQPPEADHFK